MKFSSLAFLLALPCLATARRSKWLRGGSKILTRVTHLPHEVKEYLTFHEHFMEQSRNRRHLDYCQFDITGRGRPTSDHDSVLNTIITDLAEGFKKDQDTIDQLNNKPDLKMFAAVGGQDVPWKLDHSFVMPVNGSNNKFVYMALKDDWRIRADCVRACTSCAMAAAAFKSHWMLCNRMAVHLNLERSPYAKGLAQCKLGYGRNRRTPGNNETNYYVN